VPLSRGAGTSLIQCGWPGPHCIRLQYQVASSSIQPFGYNRDEAKTVPLLGGAATPSNTMSPGQRFTSVPSGTLIHPAVWPQRTLAENWGLCTFRGGGAGSPSNTVSRRPRPTSVPSDILIHICSRLTTTDMRRKLGAQPLLGGAFGSPSTTKLPGLRPTSIPSGILMHPAVWPQ